VTNLLVTVAEAARLLSASEGTVASWLDQGLLREWARGPKRRIVDAREALLLCGLRHDLQQVTPTVVRALELDLEGTADPTLAARLAAAFARPTGLAERKLEAAIARYLALGYTPAEVAASLERMAAYRARTGGRNGHAERVAQTGTAAAS
jgi:excisionase family DNA binding protein